jgi:hypothetical protein
VQRRVCAPAECGGGCARSPEGGVGAVVDVRARLRVVRVRVRWRDALWLVGGVIPGRSRVLR